MLFEKKNELLEMLWDHQRVSLERIADAIDQGVKKIVLQLPTGAGKTETAIAQAWLYLQAWEDAGEKMMAEGMPISQVMQKMDERTPFVWLTDRQELNAQTSIRFRKWGLGVAPLTSTSFPSQYAGIDPWKAVQMFGQDNQGMVVSPAVYSNRFTADQFNEKSLMFVDEMQHSRAPTWSKPIREFPGTVIGLSATPERVNPREGFNDIYEELIQTVQIKDLEDMGVLAPVVVQAPPAHLRVYGSKPVAGDYTSFSVTGSERVFNEQAVKYVYEHANDRQCLWFTYNQAHCIDLARMMAKYVPAEKIAIVLSKTNKGAEDYEGEGFITDREEVITKTLSGDLWIIFNVMVYTEGIDAYGINCIITDRPTQSPIVWNQQIGRGRRPDPRFDYCLVIDFTGNTEEMGHPSQGHYYFLEPRVTKPATRPGPAKECKECGLYCAPACRQCPDCGYWFGKDCPTCYRFRPWKRWRRGQESDQEEHRCDLCQQGARPPLMFQNGFNDHLKDEILYLSFEEASWHNTHHRLVWKRETGNVYHIETLLQDSESGNYGWVASGDDASDLEYYAVIIDERVSDPAIRDLWEKEKLERLVETRVLSQEKYQRILDEGIDEVCPLPIVESQLVLTEPEPIVLEDEETNLWDDINKNDEYDNEKYELFDCDGLWLFGWQYKWHLQKDILSILNQRVQQISKENQEIDDSLNQMMDDESWMDDIDDLLDIEPSIINFQDYTLISSWRESSRKNGVFSRYCTELKCRVWVGNDKRGYGYVWGIYPDHVETRTDKDTLQKVSRGRMVITTEFETAVRQSYDVLVGMHKDGMFNEGE